MTCAPLHLAGERLMLCPTGTLHWPAERTLVVLVHHDAAPSGVVFQQYLERWLMTRHPAIADRLDSNPPMWWPVIAGPALVAAGTAWDADPLRRLGVALCSLSAAALGDIGRHFPDTDAALKGADSVALLAEAAQRVRAAGYQIVNIDSTIVAQAPKMAPHIAAMRERIAAALSLDMARVNVKAKTAEQMGPVGEGRAIEARAICLLQLAG